MNRENYTLRYDVRDSDVEAVGRIVESTGFFNEEEIGVARELAEERLAKGEESGYEFCFLELEGETACYACYGRIPCTKGSYDLYWIATDARFQGRGLGQIMMKAVEEDILKRGGTGIYIETSSRPQYRPTVGFYEKTGYRLEAHFTDFYDKDDGKYVFVKKL
ncbi:MAG: GNAT family N-acetyltransferase [Bacteroidota bacterium]